MATTLIRLKDGTLVEAEVPQDKAKQISGGAAKKVDATFQDEIKPLLERVASSVSVAWSQVSQDLHMEQAEIEVNVAFEGEGNLFVTRSKLGASLTIKLVLKPSSP
jgi:hypothetical protein